MIVIVIVICGLVVVVFSAVFAVALCRAAARGDESIGEDLEMLRATLGGEAPEEVPARARITASPERATSPQERPATEAPASAAPGGRGSRMRQPARDASAAGAPPKR